MSGLSDKESVEKGALASYGQSYYTIGRRSARMLDETTAAAQALGLHVQRTPAPGLEDFDSAFRAMVREQTQAVVVLNDLTFWYHRARIAELSTRHRLPSVYGQREPVEAGGLMGYGVDLNDTYRLAAMYVDRILKGAKPGDLPIEQAAQHRAQAGPGLALLASGR